MTQDARLRTDIEPVLDVDLIKQRLSTLDAPSSYASTARIRATNEPIDRRFDAQVLRASALGIELSIERIPNGPIFDPGVSVSVELQDEDRPTTFLGSVVSKQELSRNRVQLAVRIHERTDADVSFSERRREMRWHCSSQYYPTGVASNPAKYNDFVYFRVQDISRRGMRILTSMRNKFIARDMVLDGIVSFPLISQITLRLRVGNVSITNEEGKDYLSVGVEVIDMNDARFEIVAQYLAQFGDESVLKSLRADGALPKTVSDSLEFAFVRSSAEYRDVLELRRAAYAAEGKIPPGTSADDMSDIFDSRSRIVVCKLRGRIVASARLTFHEQTDLLEHEEFLNWSPDLPRRDESVEVTRACTHPEYRGARFFFPLLGFIVMTAMQARRSWVVTSSTADLVGLYERIGMIRLKRTYDNPMLNNTKHYLLIGSTNDAVLGRSVGPIIWNLVWKRAAEFAITSLDLAVDPASRVRLLLYRAVGPVVPMLRLFQNLVGVRKRRGGP